MARDVRREIMIASYLLRQKILRAQALPAGADARTAVSLQSRLRRLRQDRASRRRAGQAPVGQGVPRRRGRMRRPDGRHRRRRAADPQGHRRNRARRRRAEKIRQSLHQRPASARKSCTCSRPRPISPGRSISTVCREAHDKAVELRGAFDMAVSAIREARARGFNVNVNATIFEGMAAERVAAFMDFAKSLGVGVSISPGYAYERAPDQEHFLSRRRTKALFRRIFELGKGKNWPLLHTGLYLDFLAGNRQYACTPWGMPTRNVFGWQKPCYLLGEGHAASFRELMDTTPWERYGTGKHEKCANCMAHCGYEPTAVDAAISHPLANLWRTWRGPRTDGPMAPEPAARRAAGANPRRMKGSLSRRRALQGSAKVHELADDSETLRFFGANADIRYRSPGQILRAPRARGRRGLPADHRAVRPSTPPPISRSIPTSTPCCRPIWPGGSRSRRSKRRFTISTRSMRWSTRRLRS